MLLDSHDLYTVVATGNDAGQYLLTEFIIGRYTLLFARHADMAFIDKQGGGIGLKLLHLELIRCGLPHLSTEEIGLLVLHYAAYIGGDALARATIPVHLQFVVVLVLDSLGRELHLPVAMSIQPGELILGLLLPSVEITYKIYLRSIGCPLAEGPTLLGLVQAIIFISFGNIFELLSSVVSEFILATYVVVVAALNRSFVRFQPRVVLDEF